MSNCDIVKRLAEGYTVKEISVVCGININTLQTKITKMRDVSNSKTLAQLVASYFRKKLIE